MFGVVIPYTHNQHEENQWAFVLSNFCPDKIWVVGDAPADHLKVLHAEGISHVSEIETDASFVLCQPMNGKNVSGEVCLYGFPHPENVIYIFGSNHVQLEKEDLEGIIYQSVYVPTDNMHDMYSFVAAAVIFYDRNRKWQTK